MGYDEAVLKAHEQGWDHKLLLDGEMADLVGRVDADEPLVVFRTLTRSSPSWVILFILLTIYCLRA